MTLGGAVPPHKAQLTHVVTNTGLVVARKFRTVNSALVVLGTSHVAILDIDSMIVSITTIQIQCLVEQ